MKDIVIETHNDGDEVAINDLFNTIFNQKRDLREWEWKFKESPVDSRPFIVLAKDGDKVVGQYACVVCNMKYRDKIVKLAQPVDNFVHEDYRGGVKGTQFQLYAKAEEGWKENEVGLVYGFPNREAYIVGKRILKYIDLIKIENLFKRLNLRLALKNRMSVPFLVNLGGYISSIIIRSVISISQKPIKGVTYKWISKFDERVDSFWQTVHEQYQIIVQRDSKYLNWRYCNKPDNDYHILQAERNGKIIGILVVKFEDHGDARIGFIMECLTVREPQLMEKLINKGLIRLSKNKVDYALVRLSANDPTKEIYLRNGFVNKEEVWSSNFVHIHPRKYSATVEEDVIKDGSLWHVSFGDCDSL